MKTLNCKLLRKNALTHDVFEFDFDFGEGLDPLEGAPAGYQAGQFFTMKVADGQSPPANRSYSIASAPSETAHFRLCVKLIENGRGSEFLRNMKVGDHANFMAPLGRFVLKGVHENVVMVATGTGLAPFMGMIPTLLEQGFPHKLTLIFGVRFEKDLFYVDQVKAWEEKYENFEAKITLSRPEENWTGLTGRVTDHFEELDVDPEKTCLYICGVGAMVKDMVEHAKNKGFTKEKIHHEKFSAN